MSYLSSFLCGKFINIAVYEIVFIFTKIVDTVNAVFELPTSIIYIKEQFFVYTKFIPKLKFFNSCTLFTCYCWNHYCGINKRTKYLLLLVWCKFFCFFISICGVILVNPKWIKLFTLGTF